jgi:hypothetical protein
LGVAIVTAFCALLHRIATYGGGTDVGIALTFVAHFDLARGRAAIVGILVAVVTQLGKRNHAVSAPRHPLAGLTWRAREPAFDRKAVGCAAVSRFLIAVVAGFVVRKLPVAAARRRWCVDTCAELRVIEVGQTPGTIPAAVGARDIVAPSPRDTRAE